ncbi:hypothetical protein EYF80_012675 [Liparis tanakae]|uniref:Uncharacterized protein n=1 Tax=Liparis tanakae TaxID=230148 RepID=A0A4Z2IGV4_9TELE|nr:hypothetical protein EYF80_012675 [Liparis tanakae]
MPPEIFCPMAAMERLTEGGDGRGEGGVCADRASYGDSPHVSLRVAVQFMFKSIRTTAKLLQPATGEERTREDRRRGDQPPARREPERTGDEETSHRRGENPRGQETRRPAAGKSDDKRMRELPPSPSLLPLWFPPSFTSPELICPKAISLLPHLPDTVALQL